MTSFGALRTINLIGSIGSYCRYRTFTVVNANGRVWSFPSRKLGSL